MSVGSYVGVCGNTYLCVPWDHVHVFVCLREHVFVGLVGLRVCLRDHVFACLWFVCLWDHDCVCVSMSMGPWVVGVFAGTCV